jgi:hypothetical protein
MQNLEKLKEVKKIQCTKGNFDQSEYMRGLANGLILAVAIIEDKTPKYFKHVEKKEMGERISENSDLAKNLVAVAIALQEKLKGQNNERVFFNYFLATLEAMEQNNLLEINDNFKQ